MRINSLTGLSELSCWVENRIEKAKGNEAIQYSLPSWNAPENPASDCIKVNYEIDERSASPINHVHLIFGENSNHALGHSQYYYDMAGSAIFGLLSESRMAREEINSNYAYNSLGAKHVRSSRIHHPSVISKIGFANRARTDS